MPSSRRSPPPLDLSTSSDSPLQLQPALCAAPGAAAAATATTAAASPTTSSNPFSPCGGAGSSAAGSPHFAQDGGAASRARVVRRETRARWRLEEHRGRLGVETHEWHARTLLLHARAAASTLVLASAATLRTAAPSDAEAHARGCSHCGAALASLSLCGGCEQRRYCGPFCQNAGWRAGHRAVCRALRRAAQASAGFAASERVSRFLLDISHERHVVQAAEFAARMRMLHGFLAAPLFEPMLANAGGRRGGRAPSGLLEAVSSRGGGGDGASVEGVSVCGTRVRVPLPDTDLAVVRGSGYGRARRKSIAADREAQLQELRERLAREEAEAAARGEEEEDDDEDDAALTESTSSSSVEVTPYDVTPPISPLDISSPAPYEHVQLPAPTPAGEGAAGAAEGGEEHSGFVFDDDDDDDEDEEASPLSATCLAADVLFQLYGSETIALVAASAAAAASGLLDEEGEDEEAEEAEDLDASGCTDDSDSALNSTLRLLNATGGASAAGTPALARRAIPQTAAVVAQASAASGATGASPNASPLRLMNPGALAARAAAASSAAASSQPGTGTEDSDSPRDGRRLVQSGSSVSKSSAQTFDTVTTVDMPAGSNSRFARSDSQHTHRDLVKRGSSRLDLVDRVVQQQHAAAAAAAAAPAAAAGVGHHGAAPVGGAALHEKRVRAHGFGGLAAYGGIPAAGSAGSSASAAAAGGGPAVGLPHAGKAPHGAPRMSTHPSFQSFSSSSAVSSGEDAPQDAASSASTPAAQPIAVGVSRASSRLIDARKTLTSPPLLPTTYGRRSALKIDTAAPLPGPRPRSSEHERQTRHAAQES